MTATFSSILRSKQFTFLIGNDEEPIIVHSGIIAKLSAPLERLVNGPMKEAQEKTARFADLEVCDFERICEFAYSGGYTDPEATTFAESELNFNNDYHHCSDSISSREADREDAWLIAEFLATSCRKFELKFDYSGHDYFASGLPPLDRIANGWLTRDDDDDEDPSATQYWKQNITELLLGHARLYVFAGKYMIDDLRYLAMHKLHKFLADFTIYVKGREAILELVQYVYDNENIADRGTDSFFLADGDVLRMLVLDFIMLHRHTFCDFPGHRALLRQNTEYAMDYAERTDGMLQRLRADVWSLSKTTAKNRVQMPIDIETSSW